MGFQWTHEIGLAQIGRIYMKLSRGRNVQFETDIDPVNDPDNPPRTWDELNKAAAYNYSPWKFGLICQRPNTGSRWYRGNFTLGLMIDSHPRFVHFIIGVLFVEFGVSWHRK